jgi:hypothetical protein
MFWKLPSRIGPSVRSNCAVGWNRVADVRRRWVARQGRIPRMTPYLARQPSFLPRFTWKLLKTDGERDRPFVRVRDGGQVLGGQGLLSLAQVFRSKPKFRPAQAVFWDQESWVALSVGTNSGVWAKNGPTRLAGRIPCNESICRCTLPDGPLSGLHLLGIVRNSVGERCRAFGREERADTGLWHQGLRPLFPFQRRSRFSIFAPLSVYGHPNRSRMTLVSCRLEVLFNCSPHTISVLNGLIHKIMCYGFRSTGMPLHLVGS